jgi:hypothetical protein
VVLSIVDLLVWSPQGLSRLAYTFLGGILANAKVQYQNQGSLPAFQCQQFLELVQLGI